MSEMSSFYGGRSGAAFIIAKRFDGINIPQPGDGSGEATDYTYTANIYAVDENDNFKLVTEAQGGNVKVTSADGTQTSYLIAKTRDNYYQYKWKRHLNNGSNINNTNFKFPSQLAEGMVQCFKKGAETTSLVNYGAYVIIDTLLNLHDAEDPNNGKIFRRGMNIQSSDNLAGAEYIGQFIGTQGEIPDVRINHYKDIYDEEHPENTPRGSKKVYSASEDDIIPGAYYVGEQEDSIRFNDDIVFAYGKFVDDTNAITGCEIGFKLPTLVQDFEASVISPYDAKVTKLIQKDREQFIDNKWQHPFYQKWQLKIPHGYHGVNSVDLEIVPTMTMPKGFKGEDFAGTKTYQNQSLTIPSIVLTEPYEILRGADYIDGVNWCKIRYNNSILYVNRADCYMDILRYKEINFDNNEQGEITYHELGYYNIIDRMSLSDDGVLTVYYTAEPNGIPLEENLRWIDTENTQGIVLDADGTLHIYYNTVHEPLGPADPYEVLDSQGRAHDHTDMVKYVKVVDNVQIETSDNSGVEGTGDQRLIITYNITDSNGNKISQKIGNPLNYIIETLICSPTTTYPNAPSYHLLAYYSDPALRNRYRGRWVRYASEKYPGQVWSEWIDLGPVRGPAGGLHILKNVTNLNQLKNNSGVWLKPEELTDSTGHIFGYEYAGWGVTYKVDPDDPTVAAILYSYDYEHRGWYPIGSIDSANVSPEKIIHKSIGDSNLDPVDGGGSLVGKGFWFASSACLYAN